MLQKTKWGLSTLLLSGIMSSSLLAAPDYYNREVTLINHTSRDIIEFYGSNTGTSDWQEDILGLDVLPSGDQADINFDDSTGYCMFDFLAVFSDGSEDVSERFNVCDYGTLTLTD